MKIWTLLTPALWWVAIIVFVLVNVALYVENDGLHFWFWFIPKD
jgi:hypothetical protein